MYEKSLILRKQSFLEVFISALVCSRAGGGAVLFNVRLGGGRQRELGCQRTEEDQE